MPGQRKATDSVVYLAQVAGALGTNPAGATRKLKNKGIEPQILRLGKQEKKVYLVNEVLGAFNGELSKTLKGGLGRDFVGTTDAGEILGAQPGRVTKLLSRRVEPQFLTVGMRQMRVYPRAEVAAAQKARKAKVVAAAQKARTP